MLDFTVAPLPGSVDRNKALCFQRRPPVASLPFRGVWIEICVLLEKTRKPESLLLRGAWIEMKVAPGFGLALPSLPSRGAWIEIADALNDNVGVFVAPLPGSVDRNSIGYDPIEFESLPLRGAWIKMGSSCPGRSF